ncbi:MAG: hypothetical protein U0Q11_13990 [Vicinamibacterales bacterium]
MPRIAYVQRGGRLHALPQASVLGIPTEWVRSSRVASFSWPGKIRMGTEMFRPWRTSTGDESIGDFMRRRFGNEATSTTWPSRPQASTRAMWTVGALFPAFPKPAGLLRAFRSSAAVQ